MSSVNAAEAPLVTLRRKAAEHDEWDRLIDLVKRRGKGLVQALRDKIHHITAFDERWLSEWTNGTAGFEHERACLPFSCLELRNWLRQQRIFEAHELETVPREPLDNLPNYSFTFVGRALQLQELEDRIEKPTRNPKHRKQARICLSTSGLHGMGGIGKTAIAYHYARSRRARYTGIIWLDARIGNDILEQFFGFARDKAKLHLKADGGLADRLTDTFERLALALRGRILIVIDDIAVNAASEQASSKAEAQIKQFIDSLPERLFCRYDLLLTSRHEIRSVVTDPMPIERMTREDAIELFLQRSGFARDSVDLEHLTMLVDTLLGGHPLSIALLASHASQHGITDVEQLIGMVRRSLADADQLRGTRLEEYSGQNEQKASIFATFSISFNGLPKTAQLLLLTLAMFRRGVISIETVKNCARELEPATQPVKDLRRVLSAGGGRTVSARLLTRLALAQSVDGASRSEKSQVKRVELHEVIYDFVLFQWKKMRVEPEWQAVLADLESSFTYAAIRYASAKIDAAGIEFLELENLTGLLLPQVWPDLELFPSDERINASLTFWYEHFVFQNIVYDTGLQDGLLEPMISLRKYLEERHQNTGRCGLILEKLIGHAYYAHPKQTGMLAEQHFDRALALAEGLDARHDRQHGEISIARWYRIFLLDHRSNVASKNRPESTQALAIRDDPKFAPDFDAIENALPNVLKTLSNAPDEEECELLLRAAHYWGHRGNQDSFIQYQKFIAGTLAASADPISVSSRDNYLRAASYRLLALRIFRTGQFDRYIAPLAGKGKLPFVAPWITAAAQLKPQKRFESFTTLSQGIGDVAHQYRCLHFVLAIDFLATDDAAARATLLSDAEHCLKCAIELWNLAQKRTTEGEAPLRYWAWMSSSEIIMRLLHDIQAGRTIAPFEGVQQEFHAAATRIQARLRSGYPHSVAQQETQLRAIWKRLGADC